jgi:type III secretion protein J
MKTDAACKKPLLAVLRLFLFFCLALLFTGCSSQKTITNGVEERDANEILVLLASKGIEAYKIKEKTEGAGAGGGPVLWDIAVDQDRANEAMEILNTNGLPRRRTQHLLELFTSGGLVPSEMQEKIRYQAGLAEQIAGTIRKIDGVLDADVQLSFPEEDPLNPTKIKGAVTASVYVKHNGILDNPNSQLVTKIRRLVAASVQGLNFENVTVIGERARFSEAAAQIKETAHSGNEEMVKVWGVVVAKPAVGYFQALFFTLTALLALFVIITLWLVWKVLPVARHAGGIRTIFSLHPFELEELAKNIEEEEKPKEPPKTPPAAGGPKVQENVEST